jgi:PAS domain-containing protein
MKHPDFSPVSGDAIEAFGERVLRAQRRIASLHLRATDPQLHERQEAFAEASHELLLVAMEALQVAEEELRQQQETLRQSYDDTEADRDRLLRLFHQAPDGYLITDHAGMIQDANARAGEILQRDVSRLLGKPLPLLVGEVDRARFRGLLTNLGKTDSHDEWIGTLTLANRPELSRGADHGSRSRPSRSGGSGPLVSPRHFRPRPNLE